MRIRKMVAAALGIGLMNWADKKTADAEAALAIAERELELARSARALGEHLVHHGAGPFPSSDHYDDDDDEPSPEPSHGLH